MKKVFLVIAILATFFTNVATAQNLIPLKQFWSEKRADNFLTATALGERGATEAGYYNVRIEGYASASPGQGLKPLTLLWNEKNDNFSTGMADRVQHAVKNGYTNIRTECYIWENPGAGLIPLKLFWSAKRVDNYTTASEKGEADAIAAGYIFAGIEGYIKKSNASSNCAVSIKDAYFVQNGQMVSNVQIFTSDTKRSYTLGVSGVNVENIEVQINNTISYAYKLENVNGIARFDIHFANRPGLTINTVTLVNKCNYETFEAQLYQPVTIIN
jgi:hypothetical protein